MKVVLPLWVFALMALALVALVIILWSVKRRRRPHLVLEGEDDIHDRIPSIVGLTQGTLCSGNQIELVQNGAFWERLFVDLGQATRTIDFETFLAKAGRLTRRMTDALVKKAREGVEVRMMLDGSGGKEYPRNEIEELKAAGVKVARYHPFHII